MSDENINEMGIFDAIQLELTLHSIVGTERGKGGYWCHADNFRFPNTKSVSDVLTRTIKILKRRFDKIKFKDWELICGGSYSRIEHGINMLENISKSLSRVKPKKELEFDWQWNLITSLFDIISGLIDHIDKRYRGKKYTKIQREQLIKENGYFRKKI